MDEMRINEIAKTIHNLSVLTNTSIYEILMALEGYCISEEQINTVYVRAVELSKRI